MMLSLPLSVKRGAMCFVLCCISVSLAWSQPTRNGTRFDPGLTMTEPSPHVSSDHSAMVYLLGQWDVAYTTYPTDTTRHTAQGMARFSYLNRGHGFMEELHVSDFDGDGHEVNTIGFLAINPAQEVWHFGEVNSFTESVAIYDGSLDGERLILQHAVRRGGGALVTLYRMTFTPDGSDAFTQTLETSTDYGTTWTLALTKRYTRRAPSDDFMAAASTYGSPAPGAPEAAREFDFLIGTYAAKQRLTFPNGQIAAFPSTTTAVYALNGHGILEYNWFDIDVNLPDAATSIVRIYNRAMRRWESLYIANRGNALLFFGGVREGERIVLTLFETDTTAPRIPRFIFHDIQEDSYKWFSETSTDRGETFQTNWTIEMTRQQP